MNDWNVIFTIAGIGFLTAVLHTVLKQSGKEDFAHWTTLSAFIVILTIILTKLDDLFSKVKQVFLNQ